MTCVLDDISFSKYDKIVIAFSGGKDSLACLLHLIETGAELSKIEIWHHDVDGREGSTLMDWPVTGAYCIAVAKHFNMPIYFSWRKGGIEAEMNRVNSLTGNVLFESPIGLTEIPSTDRPAFYNTRRKFPQIGADLSSRWCSSYNKIDVANSQLRNDPRFRGTKTLFITGERGEESANRAQYSPFEAHKADLRNGKKYRRHIDHYRPVLHWSERQVWSIIEKFSIIPHPAYYLGFSRTSCMSCIFLNADGFKTVQYLDPDRFDRLAKYEEEFGVTMKRNSTLRNLILKGNIHTMDEAYISLAMGHEWSQSVIAEKWTLPIGAYKNGCGPS
jgi:3'-phosphoadenosine 5'-phosphosulfate sulfotransferase (PAPS reductase)/FAD synthetase